ncbi:hypothetical protein Cgig2_017944 [Carnegiea gigantea]|uniref:Uncharacterized protein n=1 Tax=Carnegiea gigantea TaxID=171969 RepID=A0A9Q1KB64_9CARY|nr:hypothetical protein Cgig2_017944 [Carnegiea gigantea]
MHNLFDLGFSGHDFTWWNCQDGANSVEERLHRFCANSEWSARFLDARVILKAFESKVKHCEEELSASSCTAFGHIQTELKRWYDKLKQTSDATERLAIFKEIRKKRDSSGGNDPELIFSNLGTESRVGFTKKLLCVTRLTILWNLRTQPETFAPIQTT